jgi:hypothetical protein
MPVRGSPRSPRYSWLFFVFQNDLSVDLRGRLVRLRVGRGGRWGGGGEGEGEA